MNSAASRFDALMQRLEKGEGTAGRLASDPELYNNLNLAAKEMRALMEAIRKDPRQVPAGQAQHFLMRILLSLSYIRFIVFRRRYE